MFVYLQTNVRPLDFWLPNKRAASCQFIGALWRDTSNIDIIPPDLQNPLRDEPMTHDSHEKCTFCSISEDRKVFCNDLAYGIWDAFPVTLLHTLIIPKRHVIDYFGLTQKELLACNALLTTLRAEVCAVDPTVEGFNIGVNNGSVAGQTIFHCHIHLIPRRPGDVIDPRGGIRNIIPGKGDYQALRK